MNEQQFKQKYKKAVHHMKADEQMKKRMEQNVNARLTMSRRPRKSLYIAASVVVAASIGLAAPTVWQQWNGTSPASPAIEVASNDILRPAASDGENKLSKEPVVIPKTELPSGDDKGIKASMLPLVVYHDNVYTESATTLEGADALALRGAKLGTTSGGIHELSSKEDYKELASTIGEADIYAVKGYDTDFRIMSYTEIDGQVYAQLFDKTNDMTISGGADLIGKLNIKDHVTSAHWESFDSWNNGLQQLQNLPVDGSLNHFVEALYNAKPIASTPELEEQLYGKEDRKLIYLTLEDKTTIALVLFGEEGLVRYGHVPVFFEVEQGEFQKFWNSLSK